VAKVRAQDFRMLHFCRKWSPGHCNFVSLSTAA
jgi:hypothetical protein